MFSTTFVKVLPFVAALLSVVAGSPLPEPDVTASAAFPETNPFAHVFNGQKNPMQVAIENKSLLNITLKSATGSLHDAESGKLLRNLTLFPYGIGLDAGGKTMLPYTFYSETKPKDTLLKIWVNYIDKATKSEYSATAYDSVITVVEPPSSWFDLQLLYTYTVILAMLGGAGYFVYSSYFVSPKKPSKAQVSAPVAVAASNTSGTYEAEWIPSHHLKSRKTKGDKSDGVASSSGDESGVEKRKTRGKRA